MPKKSRRKFAVIVGIILGFIAILLIGGILGYRQIQSNLERKRILNAPPNVVINTPSAGETIPAESDLSVNASAIGSTAINSMELWIDGVLVDQKFNDNGSQGAYHGLFKVVIEEGEHLLSVRAVDEQGLIGQSVPFPIYAVAHAGIGETEPVFAALPGESLHDIAQKIGVDVEALRAMNQDQGDGELPPGYEVKIPVAVPEDDEQGEGGNNRQNGGDQSDPPPVSIKQPELIQIPDKPPLEIIAVDALVIPDLSAIMKFKPPKMPSGLEGQFSDCKMILKWNDNADDEIHYKIWMAGQGVPARNIATVSSSPHTGPVWYQFDAPPQGLYTFWVEAENGIASQPSNFFGIRVPTASCDHYTAAYLNVEVTGMTFEGGYDWVYCYISAEGFPEKRFPADDDDFFHLTDGQLSYIFAGLTSFTLPIPEDLVIDLEGECWGWIGTTLNPIGSFSKQVPSNLWDGRAQVLESENFNIIFTVQPAGVLQAQGSYTFFDPTIPPPINLREHDTGVRYQPFHPTVRILQWDWEGDESTISGFTIYLNGEPYQTALPHERFIYNLPPAVCGAHFKFEVAANAIQGESILSQKIFYNQEPCQVYAEVHFVSLETGWTDDCFFTSCGYHCTGAESCKDAPCYVLQAYYDIWASSADYISESYWHPQISLHMQCNTVYMFNQMGDKDKLVVPIDPQDPRLRFGTDFKDDDNWPADFSYIVKIGEEVSMPLEEWPGYEEEFIFDLVTDETAWTITTIRVRGFEGMGP